MVLVGSRLWDDEKYDGGPACEASGPNDEKTLVGLAAACELSCELWRADHVASAASGDILGVASGRELRISVEAALAASRVRDAMAGW